LIASEIFRKIINKEIKEKKKQSMDTTDDKEYISD
jgi:hypothetical protein